MARLCGSALCGAAVAALQGCSDSNAPVGRGNHFVSDVDASSVSESALDATPADSPFAALDGSYGALPDGYAPLAVCAQCACGGTTFCYGGSPSSSFSGACDETASAALNVGCHAIPAGCAAEPDCVCLLQALAPEMSCYGACADNQNGGFTVYCPP